MKNLIVFTDPGVDDAIALLELQRNLVATRLYICPVAGNAPCDITFRNADAVTTNKATAIIDSFSIEQPQIEMDASYCGNDGLGDTSLRVPRLCPVPIYSFTDVIESIDEYNPIDIIIMSPATVPLQFLQILINEGYAQFINSIYIMGGCETHGNMGDLEFNQYIDPIAFNGLLDLCSICSQTYGTNLKIVTLESCEQPCLDLSVFPFNTHCPDIYIETLCIAGLNMTINRQEQHYYIYDLTLIWAYLSDIGVYPKLFEYTPSILLNTSMTDNPRPIQNSIIRPLPKFTNPWMLVK